MIYLMIFIIYLEMLVKKQNIAKEEEKLKFFLTPSFNL